MLQMLRLPAVLRARGRGRSSHYQDIRDGLCTSPVPIGDNAVAWPDYEIEAINEARLAGKTDDAIRELVRSLEAARTAGPEAARACAANASNQATPQVTVRAATTGQTVGSDTSKATIEPSVPPGGTWRTRLAERKRVTKTPASKPRRGT